MMTAIELARRFFGAIEAGDAATVADCYADDAVIWHNTDRAEQGKADNLAVLRGFIGRTTARSYGNARLLATEEGFVQQHVLECTRVDGRRLELPACVICTVEAGKIVRLDEYFDEAPLKGWFDLG